MQFIKKLFKKLASAPECKSGNCGCKTTEPITLPKYTTGQAQVAFDAAFKAKDKADQEEATIERKKQQELIGLLKSYGLNVVKKTRHGVMVKVQNPQRPSNYFNFEFWPWCDGSYTIYRCDSSGGTMGRRIEHGTIEQCFDAIVHYIKI